MSYSVYKHTFPNGKVYIGITQQKPEIRWNYGSGYRSQPLMSRAINKYGWQNILHEILFDNQTKEEAEQKEIELIAKYQSNKREFGYNIMDGGRVSIPLTDETKQKISMALKGKMSGKNNPMYGKHHSDSARKKMSEAHKGVKFSEEHKSKISKSLSGKNNPNYGKVPSKESRKKMSNAKLGKKNSFYGKSHSNETKNNISKAKSKPVRCIENNTIYLSISDACLKTNIDRSDIGKCCNKKKKTAGGYHWEFAEKGA